MHEFVLINTKNLITSWHVLSPRDENAILLIITFSFVFGRRIVSPVRRRRARPPEEGLSAGGGLNLRSGEKEKKKKSKR